MTQTTPCTPSALALRGRLIWQRLRLWRTTWVPSTKASLSQWRRGLTRCATSSTTSSRTSRFDPSGFSTLRDPFFSHFRYCFWFQMLLSAWFDAEMWMAVFVVRVNSVRFCKALPVQSLCAGIAGTQRAALLVMVAAGASVMSSGGTHVAATLSRVLIVYNQSLPCF